MNLKAALASGGALLTAGAFLLGTLFGEGAKPVENVVEPAAEQVGLSPSACPTGWDDTSVNDEHVHVRSCERNGWQVILKPDGGFNHALHLDTPGADFVYDPGLVPNWPR